MSKTKNDDMKKKSIEELKEMLFSLREEHFNLRIQKAMGQLQNTARLRTVRKDIARVHTFLSAKKASETR